MTKRRQVPDALTGTHEKWREYHVEIIERMTDPTEEHLSHASHASHLTRP